MTTRMRSGIGSLLTVAGIGLMLAAAFTLRSGLLWGGLGAAVPGVVLILWALRDALRQLGENQARFEAALRSQVPPKGERRPE